MINYKPRKYDVYLNSSEWKTIRNEVLARDNNTCQICGCKQNLQVHHIKYFEVKNSDYMVTLCEMCHVLISDAVIEFNNHNFKDKLDFKWLQGFCSDIVLELYKKSYCLSGDKSKNFLELKHFRSVIGIVRSTLKYQNKAPSDLIELENTRISTVAFQLESQRLITGYRRQYIFLHKIEGLPDYKIKSDLGMSDSSYYKFVKGG